MRTIKTVSSLALLLLFMGAGCFGGGNSAAVADGGVYVSSDKGETWQARTAVASTTGQVGSIAGVSVRSLAIDPSDRKAWYIGTEKNGLMYTYDGGATWQQATGLSAGMVYATAVDAKNKCTIYATSGRDIVRTNDCSRTFNKIYSEAREGTIMVQLAVDPVNTNIIYAASSSGDLVKSLDGGKNWAVATRFNDEVRQIFIYPNDPNHLYVGLLAGGLRKSADGGATWINVTPNMSTYSGASSFRGLAWAEGSKNETFVLATKYGLFRTNNGGDSWEALNLVTGPGEVTIFGLAVNPTNTDEIMYSTAAGRVSNTFFTADGGKTWQTKKAPTTRAMYRFVFDKEGQGIIAGTYALPQ